MASVSAKSSDKGDKLCCINIEMEANGFVVRKDYEPKESKNGPMYVPSRRSDRMVFTSPSKLISHIRECLGSKEGE